MKLRILKIILITTGGLLLFSAGYLFIGSPPPAKEISWGVNFSQKHAELLGLNWQEIYSAMLNDLKVKNVKLLTHWDIIEPKAGEYYFNDLDWQVEEGAKAGAKILLVIGMKTGRWPECHLPGWAKTLSKNEQQERTLKLIEATVLRYRDSETIKIWQVENEPLFPFGVCPWRDEKFLKREIALVKTLDRQQRKILISDSGESSFWVAAARLGDIVGTTLYRESWFKEFGRYVRYHLPPTFYWRKAQIIKKLFDKEVMVVELQAEPWGPRLLYDSPLKEQEKTMNLKKFKGNIAFAQKTGLKEFYLWGGEWWYWLKVKQNQPEIWNEAKKLFSQ